MKYEVEKFVKAKREDYDDTRTDGDSAEALETFRAQRVADPLGRAVADLLFGEAAQ